MILFWLICAAFILIALWFVLPPALQRSEASESKSDDERRQANIAVYRDQLSELEADLNNGIVSQEQYAQDKEEIERRLLEDTKTRKSEGKPVAAASARTTAYALGLGLPLVAVIFYLNVGSPKSIAEPAPVASETSAAPQQPTQEQIQARVAALAERLKSNPSDAQGWTMLARSYGSMERYGEAVGAYAKATELSPKDANLWAEYAFATAMAGGRSLEGKPTEFIEHALSLDPNNAKALNLAATAAFQAKDYKKAIDYWQRVLKQVPAGSEAAQEIQAQIDEAKRLAPGK
jgi:cytochrome c-type biogenesis protein CcmH